MSESLTREQEAAVWIDAPTADILSLFPTPLILTTTPSGD